MRWPISVFVLVVLVAGMLLSPHSLGQSEAPPASATPPPVSGYHYQSEQEQQLQDDSFANPGLLWVDQGRSLFNRATEAPSCASCHETAGTFQHTATTFPKWHAPSNQLFNLERQINHCRTTRQALDPLPYESDALLGLSAYVANLAKGNRWQVNFAAPQLQPHLQAGRRYYYTRRGQLNLACHHCHELNPGRMLRGDRLSQGHSNGYPAYKLEWQTVGSLHRRLRDCDVGVRAEPFPAGSTQYLDLELYLAWRAGSLPLEAPAVRR